MYSNFTYVVVRFRNDKVEKFYYGSSTNEKRYTGASKFGQVKPNFKTHNPLINYSVTKYGYECHYYLLMEEYDTREEAYEAEQVLINEAFGFENCWNISPDVRGISGEAHPCYKHTLYNWVNIYTKQKEHCTQNELIVKYGLIDRNFHAVFKGIRNHCSGWTVENNSYKKKINTGLFKPIDTNVYTILNKKTGELKTDIPARLSNFVGSKNIHEVINKKRISCGDWILLDGKTERKRIRPSSKIHTDIYTFVNIDTNEQLNCTLGHFRESLNIKRNLPRLLEGKMVERWKILKNA